MPSFAQAAARNAPAPSPRLVVLIVIDQFRYDLIARFRAHYVDGGFARFLDHGARFTRARYRHGTTETCPGHAVIATGTWGRDNGVIANRWFDAARGTVVGCAVPERPASVLLRPTIVEEIERASAGESKSVVASEKDSAAQMLAGAAADGTYWLDASAQFTSWRDGPPLPDWAEGFNRTGQADSYLHGSWDRLLPEAVYARFGADDVPGESGADGRSHFPHALAESDWLPEWGSRAALLASPFADTLLARFAIAAIDGEQLGADDVTDFLGVSFSASDRVAHRFGPDSQEYMDTIVRLDRELARLIDAIDAKVGLDRTLLILTADHGVAPMPEVARQHDWGRAARRLPKETVGGTVERTLNARYGPPASGQWLAFQDFPNVYLDREALESRGIDPEEAAGAVRDAIAALPGVQRAWTRGDLVRLGAAAGAKSSLDRAALLSFRPERSGDIVYEVAAYTIVAEVGSSHGSHWNYDARVPMIWLGPGIVPGAYGGPASPVDIAPTVYALLGLEDPGTSGRVLREMLAKTRGRAHPRPH